MKKLGVLFLVVLMTLTFTACKKEKTVKDKTVDEKDNFTEIIDISEDEADDESEDADKTDEAGQSDNANKVDDAGKTQNGQSNQNTEKTENTAGTEDEQQNENTGDTTQGDKVDDSKTNIELPVIGVN